MELTEYERSPVPKTLGLAVITKNEELKIERCLNSVPFAQRKIVVDSQSTDRTCEIARRCGAEVVIRPWPGYSKQKQFAMDQLDTDWILCLDADEWLAPECAREIQALLQSEPEFEAYRIPRFHFFLGKIIRHGKGVDHPLRLLKRGSGRYTDRVIHEEIAVSGRTGILHHGMIHHSSESVVQRIAKIQRDTDAELHYAQTVSTGIGPLLIQPCRYFLSYVFKRGGWRDGFRGLLLIALFSYQLFLQQLKFLRAQRRRPYGADSPRG